MYGLKFHLDKTPMAKTIEPDRIKSPAFLYLHGFASGPSSTKARFFSSRLQELGAGPSIPDLNGPSFEHMTLTSQLQIADRALSALENADVVIFGSSMGGLLATLLAQKCARTRALVLLAPGFGLPRRWTAKLGEEGVEQWRLQGFTEVFHYAFEKQASLRYDFIVDALNYETDNLKVSIPTLVFHGKNDTTVPVEESLHFAADNPGRVELHILDDGHELIEPLEHMWRTTHTFLRRLGLLPD